MIRVRLIPLDDGHDPAEVSLGEDPITIGRAPLVGILVEDFSRVRQFLYTVSTSVTAARAAECRSMRAIYSWSDGSLKRIGAVSDAHLRAWEYEVAADEPVTTADAELRDSVRLWRTRRPDLAPPELWVGDVDH